MQVSIAKKYRDDGIGPGGWHCPCCGPRPNDRKTFMRLVRRRIKRKEDKYEKIANGDSDE